MLRVSETRDYFINEEKKFFYLADTIWAAFTNTTMDEWEEYLDYRKMQNFNVLQISILPILHDMSDTELNLHPFKFKDDGNYDYYSINDEYFAKVVNMVHMAVQKSFIPALVPLWANYVPGTWAAEITPGKQMPFDAVASYIKYIAELFSKYDIIYLVGGDTKFETEEVSSYYMSALKEIKAISPEALTAMHLAIGLEEMPKKYECSNNLDFHMYQSGHLIELQYLTHKLADVFYKKEVKRPVLNGEPCYEGSGYGFKYGRFTNFDVRKAMWQSILSGAKAGFTYGAHGIWNWHKKGKSFNGAHFSSMPYDWKTALRLKGAWDVSFGKEMFERYNMFDIEPVNRVLDNAEEIKMAASKDWDKIVIYVPYSTDIKIDADLDKYKFTMINLEERYFAKPEVEIENKRTIIKMHDFNSDVLIIAQR